MNCCCEGVQLAGDEGDGDGDDDYAVSGHRSRCGDGAGGCCDQDNTFI